MVFHQIKILQPAYFLTRSCIKTNIKMSTSGIGDKNTIKTALLQILVSNDKNKNLEKATSFIKTAKENGANLVILPECFNSPYGLSYFKKYAESIPTGQTCGILSEAAKEHSLHIVGGTIPELDGDKLYNTCTVWDSNGNLVAKYRKMHLFDIDIPGKITFKESEILSPGNNLATFDVSGVKVGLGICYDLRFEELAKLYRLRGCDVLVYPGAFNTTTGPLHWEILQRGRATDNQVFVISASPARGTEGYIAYGFSQVTNPWGKVLCQATEKEEILYCDLDLSEIGQVRQQIPVSSQRRTDVYDTVESKGKC